MSVIEITTGAASRTEHFWHNSSLSTTDGVAILELVGIVIYRSHWHGTRAIHANRNTAIRWRDSRSYSNRYKTKIYAQGRNHWDWWAGTCAGLKCTVDKDKQCLALRVSPLCRSWSHRFHFLFVERQWSSNRSVGTRWEIRRRREDATKIPLNAAFILRVCLTINASSASFHGCPLPVVI